MANDPTRLTANFGGGMATLSPALPPTLALEWPGPVGFGNDKTNGAPVTLTFDVPMNSAGVQVVYQAPQLGTVGASDILDSASLVRATFYGTDGAEIGRTTLATPGANGQVLGANYRGNAPQGYVLVSAPIARMTVEMPRAFQSAAWLASAVAAGVVDYDAVQAAADAANLAQAKASTDLANAATAARQAKSDALALVSAVQAAERTGWADLGVGNYAANELAIFQRSYATYLDAVAVSATSVGLVPPLAQVNDRDTVADAAAFFASWQTPTIPAQYGAAVTTFGGILDKGTQTPTDSVGVGPATNTDAQRIGAGLPPSQGFTPPPKVTSDPLGFSPTRDESAPVAPPTSAPTAPAASAPSASLFTSTNILLVVLVAIIIALLARG